MTTYSVYIDGKLHCTYTSLRFAQIEAVRLAQKGEVRVMENFPSGKTQDITEDLIGLKFWRSPE